MVKLCGCVSNKMTLTDKKYSLDVHYSNNYTSDPYTCSEAAPKADVINNSKYSILLEYKEKKFYARTCISI